MICGETEIGPIDQSVRPIDFRIGDPPLIQIHGVVGLESSVRRNKSEPPLGVHRRVVGKRHEHYCILASNASADNAIVNSGCEAWHLGIS